MTHSTLLILISRLIDVIIGQIDRCHRIYHADSMHVHAYLIQGITDKLVSPGLSGLCLAYLRSSSVLSLLNCLATYMYIVKCA